jgi:phage/plasmid-associated DNA primase
MPKATHWFASNYLPRSRDASEGFNRRWVILSFNRIVPDSEKIRGLGDIIVAEEREAIASWCIGAMAELNSASDYDLPESHYKLINSMTAENDSVFFYLTSEEEGPRAYEKGEILLQKLYETYRTFCYGKVGAKPVGLRRFLARLNELAIIFGLSVDNSKVYGLTLEREKGSVVSRVRR